MSDLERQESIEGAPDYDTWLGQQPEALRQQFEQRTIERAYAQFNRALEQEYGDILPLVVDAKADETFRKKLTRLKDKSVRDLYAASLDSYDGRQPGGATQTEDNPLAEDVKSIKQTLSQQEQQRQWDVYTTARDREFLALQNEFPQLRGNDKLGAHIREIAEARTMKNLQRGNANAVPYKDVYDEFVAATKEAPPPAAPATSAAGVSERPQAPRTAAEGRDKALTMLRTAGGFSRLQSSLAARARS